MKNRKKFICWIILFLLVVIFFSILFIERYQYSNVCKKFFLAIETKDLELMDEIFYEYARFDYQNTMYRVVRDENLTSLKKIDYEIVGAEIKKELVFIDCIQNYASIHFIIEIGSDHTGNKNELTGWLHVEKMEDGSYKITEIFIYETNNTKFLEQLFGEVRK